MNDILFEMKNLKKSFGKRLILDIPSIQLDKEKIYAIVGPNGSGKTTFLKMLNTLEKPTSGNIFYKGKDLFHSRNSDSVLKEMTLIMQNPYLFNTTVFKNVAYGLRIRGVDNKTIKKRVEETLDLVGLSDLKERRAYSLSGGEAQRVAIARGLVIDPEVLLLDEPTANVDQLNVGLIEELIVKIHQEKATSIIMTTHNQPQAHLLADRVLSIINNRLTDNYYENIFQGEIKEANGISIFSKNNLEICLKSEKTGKAIISVDPRDIILSLKPFDSSARNCFQGKIKKMSEIKDLIKVVVDTGLDFSVVLTKNSCSEMGLTIGKEVFVTFKTSSVSIY